MPPWGPDLEKIKLFYSIRKLLTAYALTNVS